MTYFKNTLIHILVCQHVKKISRNQTRHYLITIPKCDWSTTKVKMVKIHKNRIEETNKHKQINTKRFFSPKTTIFIKMDVINIFGI